MGEGTKPPLPPANLCSPAHGPASVVHVTPTAQVVNTQTDALQFKAEIRTCVAELTDRFGKLAVEQLEMQSVVQEKDRDRDAQLEQLKAFVGEQLQSVGVCLCADAWHGFGLQDGGRGTRACADAK